MAWQADLKELQELFLQAKGEGGVIDITGTQPRVIEDA